LAADLASVWLIVKAGSAVATDRRDADDKP
jgi:hypothetical protein